MCPLYFGSVSYVFSGLFNFLTYVFSSIVQLIAYIASAAAQLASLVTGVADGLLGDLGYLVISLTAGILDRVRAFLGKVRYILASLGTSLGSTKQSGSYTGTTCQESCHHNCRSYCPVLITGILAGKGTYDFLNKHLITS